jgi:thioredoxin-like negative regulator of GroEL
MAIDFSEHIKFGRLDIAIAEDWATCYRIRVVPTLLFFKEEQVIEQVVGGLTEADLNRKLTSLIASKPINRSCVSCL